MDMYDKEGHPISLEEWGALSRDLDYKVIAKTEIAGMYVVSTVWLGLDHSFDGGPPLIFETMVFTRSAWYADRSDPNREPMHELDMDRYSTLEEALAGHERMVEKIRRS